MLLEFYGYDFGISILWVCFGMAIAGGIFAYLFYGGYKNISTKFWQYFSFFQTIMQTLSILIIMGLMLGPNGFIWKLQEVKQGASICIQDYVDWTIYPNGRFGGSEEINYNSSNKQVSFKKYEKNNISNFTLPIKGWETNNCSYVESYVCNFDRRD